MDNKPKSKNARKKAAKRNKERREKEERERALKEQQAEPIKIEEPSSQQAQNEQQEKQEVEQQQREEAARVQEQQRLEEEERQRSAKLREEEEAKRIAQEEANRKAEEEKKKQLEEQQRKEEEERQRREAEEQRKREEEKKRLEEEKRLQEELEKARQRKEEEELRMLEQQRMEQQEKERRAAEERELEKKQQEQQRKQAEEEERKKRQAEEHKKREEEQKRRREEEKKRHEEEERKKKEAIQKKQQEEAFKPREQKIQEDSISPRFRGELGFQKELEVLKQQLEEEKKAKEQQKQQEEPKEIRRSFSSELNEPVPEYVKPKTTQSTENEQPNTQATYRRSGMYAAGPASSTGANSLAADPGKFIASSHNDTYRRTGSAYGPGSRSSVQLAPDLVFARSGSSEFRRTGSQVFSDTSPSKQFNAPVSRGSFRVTKTEQDSFEGAGQKNGVEVWKVNEETQSQNKVKIQDIARFEMRQRYLVLNTQNGSHTLFLWSGVNASNSALLFTLSEQLKKNLPDCTVHSEAQNAESAAFLAVFSRTGLTYLMDPAPNQGKPSNANANPSNANAKPRLFQLQPSKGILRLVQLEPSASALNSSCVFLLDIGTKLFQWNGSHCSRMDTSRGMQTAVTIRTIDMGGKGKTVVLEEGQESADDAEWSDFWNALGGRP